MRWYRRSPWPRRWRCCPKRRARRSAPSLSLSQGAGARAAGTHDLGMTINFDPSSANDTPKTLQIALAARTLANADIDGGRCLEATANRASCEVGTGTATASAIVVPGTAITPPITAPATIDLTYYLVAPPKSRGSRRPLRVGPDQDSGDPPPDHDLARYRRRGPAALGRPSWSRADDLPLAPPAGRGLQVVGELDHVDVPRPALPVDVPVDARDGSASRRLPTATRRRSRPARRWPSPAAAPPPTARLRPGATRDADDPQVKLTTRSRRRRTS